MKLLRIACFVVVSLAFLRDVSAQGFVNLDFESASIVPVSGAPYGSVQYAQAFPGWTETVVGGISPNALYNNLFLDSTGISILDHNWTQVSWLPVIQGNYTAVLQAGFGYLANGPTPEDISLSQTGLIPLGINSVQFTL